MIKMVATDIDGTIYNWGVGVSDNVKKCIKKMQEQGVKVVLVTGRMHSAAKLLATELGLNTPVVSYQGGLIKENCENGIEFYKKTLDPISAKKILSWARQKKVHTNLYINDVLIVEEENDIVQKYAEVQNITYQVKNFDELKIEDVNKILIVDYSDAEVVTEYKEFLEKEHEHLYIVKSSPYYCEISHNEARKSCAVEHLCKIWDIKKEEVLTIGDQNNDIELLKAGGVAVAMGNATDELKTYANHITDSVENDGFVKAMEKFVLI
ncbi:MAG: Cof-type HAD-IIB family hydrolase [Candidatus Gastranaerophilales bacterium]